MGEMMEFSPEEMAAALAVWESDAIQAQRQRPLAQGVRAHHVKLALAKIATLSELPMHPHVMLVMLSSCALAMAALED